MEIIANTLETVEVSSDISIDTDVTIGIQDDNIKISSVEYMEITND